MNNSIVTQFSQSLAQEIYSSEQQFPVSFDDAWVWLGYSRKDNAKRHFEGCGFVKGTDYALLTSEESVNHAGFSPQALAAASRREDIYLSAECLKQWGMMAGTEQGKQIRLYFLECERIAKQKSQAQLPTSYIQALESLLVAEKEKEALRLKAEKQQEVIAALAPVVEVHNILLENTSDTFDLGAASKLMGFKEFGRTRLFEKLRELNILQWNNLPYQSFVDSGYFVVKQSHSYNGQHISLQPRLTQRGLSWLTRKFIGLGYVSTKVAEVSK